MQATGRENMRSRIAQYGRSHLGVILGVFALVVALTGSTAIAQHGHALKLGMFDNSSRDRLAGTGVIQYAATAYNVGNVSDGDLKTYTVKCELSKKATSGGFKWTKAAPPPADAVELLDAYPNGSGFVVRIRFTDDANADNQTLTVYSNCVKSRHQRGTPPV